MTATHSHNFPWLQRMLMIFVPDSAATATGVGIATTAFVLGCIELFSRQFSAAENCFYLAVGMVTFLTVMKYMALRANMLVAQYSNEMLKKHMQRIRTPAPKLDLSNTEKQALIEQAARERAEMVETLGILKEAIKHIQPDAPIRPKYEATIEMMERALRKS